MRVMVSSRDGDGFCRRLLRLACALALGVSGGALTSGCRAPTQNRNPIIEFTVVPPADNGGPERVAPVSGRVRGAGANQRVVLFARSGAWGDPRNKNAQYVLQFEDVADNVFRYSALAGLLTHVFR